MDSNRKLQEMNLSATGRYKKGEKLELGKSL
jgi:hypothetical protein